MYDAERVEPHTIRNPIGRFHLEDEKDCIKFRNAEKSFGWSHKRYSVLKTDKPDQYYFDLFALDGMETSTNQSADGANVIGNIIESRVQTFTEECIMREYISETADTLLKIELAVVPSAPKQVREGNTVEKHYFGLEKREDSPLFKIAKEWSLADYALSKTKDFSTLTEKYPFRVFRTLRKSPFKEKLKEVKDFFIAVLEEYAGPPGKSNETNREKLASLLSKQLLLYFRKELREYFIDRPKIDLPRIIDRDKNAIGFASLLGINRDWKRQLMHFPVKEEKFPFTRAPM